MGFQLCRIKIIEINQELIAKARVKTLHSSLKSPFIFDRVIKTVDILLQVTTFISQAHESSQ